jgi:hypothetical protein
VAAARANLNGIDLGQAHSQGSRSLILASLRPDLPITHMVAPTTPKLPPSQASVTFACVAGAR